MKDIKWISIHGDGKSYKACIFKLQNNEVLAKAGFGRTQDETDNYRCMILWGPESYLIIDSRYGMPYWALSKHGLKDPILIAAWETVLRRFDEIPDKGNIEVTLVHGQAKVKIEKAFRW